MLLANVSAGFVCSDDDTLTASLAVYLQPASAKERASNPSVLFDWIIKLDPGVTFSDGATAIGEKDTITWTDSRGNERHGELAYAGETFGPLASQRFFVTEVFH